MKNFIAGFTKQLEDAIEIGKNSLPPRGSIIQTNIINNIVISGLGGSGIGASIVSQLVENDARVPVIVNKNYFLPSFVNKHTLAIFSSYSGNTEETLQAFETAIKRKAIIVCITSGGKLMNKAKQHGFYCIQLPAGYPPRAAFAYSFTQLFFVLWRFGIITDAFILQLKSAIKLLEKEEKNTIDSAQKIAETLHNKIPVIYSDASCEGIAIRFRQQINENSKMLCWHHVVPEMNHNELVGWREKRNDMAVVFLKNSTDYTRTQTRMNINKEIISKYTPHLIEVFSKGNTGIERSLYLIHLFDWVSVLLADIKGIDPMEVKVIDFLKSELEKIKNLSLY